MSSISILSATQTSELLQHSDLPIPFYLKPDFLNQIYSDSWQSVVLTSGEKILVYFPFFLSRTRLNRFRCSSFPLIPYVKIYHELNNTNKIKKFSKIRTLLIEISKTLKEYFKVIQINLSPENSYLSPFLWEGYKLLLRYEFVLLRDSGKPYMQWGSDVKRRIKRATELGYTIVKPSYKEACQLYHRMLPHLWKRYEPYLKAFFQMEHPNLIKIGAVDSNGNFIGLGTFLKTNTALIYNIGVHHKADSYGGPFLLDHAITLAFDEGLDFHFGGSIIPSIDHFFGNFGAQPMPFYQVNYKPLIYRLWELFTS